MVGTYLLEAGLVLVVAPWTPFWEQNYFVTGAVRGFFLSPWLRGALSGVGFATIVAGLLELIGVFIGRYRSESQSAGTSS